MSESKNVKMSRIWILYECLKSANKGYIFKVAFPSLKSFLFLFSAFLIFAFLHFWILWSGPIAHINSSHFLLIALQTIKYFKREYFNESTFLSVIKVPNQKMCPKNKGRINLKIYCNFKIKIRKNPILINKEQKLKKNFIL
jgi:hypothetical protein